MASLRTNDDESDNDKDDEFRRAQEMALAVAALTPKSQPRTAEAIRMAVADAMVTNPSKTLVGELPNFRKRKQAGQRQNDTRNTNEHQLDDDVEFNVCGHLFGNLVERQLGENVYYQELKNKILQGWDIVSVVIVMHVILVYLIFFPSESAIHNLINASFVVNMTVLYCLTNSNAYRENLPNNKSSTGKTDKSYTRSTIPDEGNEQQQQLMPIESKSNIKLEWLKTVSFQEKDLLELQVLQPESTEAERRRFLKARKHVVKAASAQLGEYLEWRTTNRIDQFFPSTTITSSDPEDWAHAARGALEIGNTSGKHLHVRNKNQPLPRLISVFEDDLTDICVCKNGARIVHVLPCQLNSALATNSTYALAVAMYLDRKLDRLATEKVTVVIDIRSGTGWSNPSSVSIVPFIKLVVGQLNTYFPERLSRCILFPLPYTATLLFNKAKDFLDPDTAAKIQVCSGVGSTSSPIPPKVLEFIGPKAVDCMENRRKSLFR